ncbi:hypothetical protein FRC07_004685, partial [Ceratobasidium sp. 392]
MAQPPPMASSASSVSSLQEHEELANKVAEDAPQPDRAQPVAHANEGKDIQEVVDPERAAQNTGAGENGKGWQLLCGPMLKYWRLSDDDKRWHGSVLIVLRAPDEEIAKHPDEPSISLDAPDSNTKPVHLFTERDRVYWRFNMDLALGDDEREVKYSVKLPRHDTGDKIERSFWVPKIGQTFRIMFHSCNGFVPGADKEVNGLALWNDVLRLHEKSPLHVMIGGGDQIYSDGITEPHAPLYPWAQELSPRKRSKIPFPLELRNKVDDWYFQHHCDWFNASPFREANSQIPQLNLWDDHDIIDGFGTYKDAWQRAPVFMGVGEIAWKYMSLFQQHLPPSSVTPGLTYDAKDFNPITAPAHKPTPSAPDHKPKVHMPKTRKDKENAATSKPENASKANGAEDGVENGTSDGAVNEKHSDKEEELDPSYIRHPQQGPYMQHRGLSICTSLGEGVLFYGLDCRTDRTRERICYADTYQVMFDRLDKEIVPGKTKHLLLLLGVPIAYPRLVWAETLMTSRLMAPLRALNRMFGILSALFNDFDGKAELLDDLEDHWAAAVHKAERNHFVQRLQALSHTKQVRITILSGDVHLAAIGRFFSKAKLNVPQERDHRYIVNIEPMEVELQISSAITNAPPPDAVADVLNARNKLHRLDHNTAENLMSIFEEGVDGSRRLVNKTTYPARNYCVITRADPSAGPDATTAEEIGDNPAEQTANEDAKSKASLMGKIMHKDHAVRTADKGQPQSGAEKGEISGGTGTIAKEVKGAQVGHDASALAPATGTKAPDALNISLRLEVDKKSPEGKTKAYGFSIPRLERYAKAPMRKQQFKAQASSATVNTEYCVEQNDLSSQMDSTEQSSIAIAGGGFGDVYHGQLRNGTSVAIKTLRHHLLAQDTAPKARKHNVLVSQEGIAKLSDFDHSILSDCTLGFTETTNVGGGTLRWMAPELLLRQEDDMTPVAKTKQTDVYALGMTMLETITGKLPYAEYRFDTAIIRALDRRQLPNRPKELSAHDTLEDWMWSLLKTCWEHDPMARPLASLVYIT